MYLYDFSFIIKEKIEVVGGEPKEYLAFTYIMT